MGRRISKEFLHPSILEGVNNKIGNLDNLETDAKDNMVQAINELADKIDTEIAEGKELIANAVGEPLTAEESFDEMSTDINGLLSTFKTNMMNNGITVESSDRFKSLIDKIATIVEEGEGKGIQYASGITPNNFSNVQINGTNFTCLNISLNFKPTILIVRNHANYGFYIENFYPDNFSIVTVDNGYDEYRNINDYEIDKGNNNYSMPIGYEIQGNTTYYWAVGVGEEDTTLRDSLADILENKGVDVTEEDDMASLITKVDEEFSNSLSIVPGNKYTMREGTGYSSMTNITSFTEIDSYTFANNGTFTCTMDVCVQGSVSSGSMTGKLELYDSNNELIYTSEEITSTVDEDDSTKTLTVDLEVKKGYIIKLLIITSGLTLMSIGLSSGISITFDLN